MDTKSLEEAVESDASDEPLLIEESVHVAKSADYYGTSSKATRVFGLLAAAFALPYLLFAFVFSSAHEEQMENVRLLYVHVPTVLVAYLSFFGTLLGSILYLRKKSIFWDLFAGSCAEVGVLFCSLVIATGAIWGQPTWNTYWEWDPRLTSTAVLFIMYLGYLAVRRMDLSEEARSRRSAVIGIISFFNIIIVHYSVQWWRGLHQGETFRRGEPLIDGLRYFSFFLGIIFFILVGAWLVIHRFRLAWLQRSIVEIDLEEALAERWSENEQKI